MVKVMLVCSALGCNDIIREFKQRRFSNTINQDWTSCILRRCFCPKFQANHPSKTNFIMSGRIKRKNASLLVDMCRWLKNTFALCLLLPSRTTGVVNK